EAARAAVALADQQRSGAQSRLSLAEANERRSRQLVERDLVTRRSYDEAATALATARAQLNEAEANLELRQSELAAAEARLIGPDDPPDDKTATCCVAI